MSPEADPANGGARRASGPMTPAEPVLGRDVWDWREGLIADKSLTPATRLLGVRLSMYANVQTGACFPSESTLANNVGTSRTRVHERIGELVARGWVQYEREGKIGRAASYLLTLPAGDPARAGETGGSLVSVQVDATETPNLHQSGAELAPVGGETCTDGGAVSSEPPKEVNYLKPASLADASAAEAASDPPRLESVWLDVDADPENLTSDGERFVIVRPDLPQLGIDPEFQCHGIKLGMWDRHAYAIFFTLVWLGTEAERLKFTVEWSDERTRFLKRNAGPNRLPDIAAVIRDLGEPQELIIYGAPSSANWHRLADYLKPLRRRYADPADPRNCSLGRLAA